MKDESTCCIIECISENSGQCVVTTHPNSFLLFCWSAAIPSWLTQVMQIDAGVAPAQVVVAAVVAQAEHSLTTQVVDATDAGVVYEFRILIWGNYIYGLYYWILFGFYS
jgi:hypothetical protein